MDRPTKFAYVFTLPSDKEWVVAEKYVILENQKVYVLYFNEWPWEDGDECFGSILGVFTDEKEANENLESAKKENSHGDYSVKKVELNKFSRYGF